VRMAVWRRAIVIAALAPWLACAAITICPRCGYEADSGAVKCLHCGADLTPAATPTPAPTPSTPPGDVRAGEFALPADVLEDQIAQARKFHGEKIWWGTIFFGRNALALLALGGRDEAIRSAEVSRWVDEVVHQVGGVPRRCEACSGTGHRRLRIVTLEGQVVDQEISAQPCPACGGEGARMGRVDSTEFLRQKAEAERVFVREQQRRGLENVQGIWLPYGAGASLSLRQQAAIKKATGGVCEACGGMGRFGCDACGGTGRLACSNGECVQGVEICPDCGGKGRKVGPASSGTSSSTTGTSASQQVFCETCKGAGKRTCTICSGRGVLECATCKGRGERLCAACKGTGRAPMCTKCTGEGLIPCSRCAGTGEYRDAPCPYCKGNKTTLCPTCGGTGAAQRRR